MSNDCLVTKISAKSAKDNMFYVTVNYIIYISFMTLARCITVANVLVVALVTAVTET